MVWCVLSFDAFLIWQLLKTTCKFFSLDALGIDGVDNASEYKVYPNPVAGQLNIEAPTELGSYQISIRDIQGRQVYHSKENGGQLIQISTSELNPGIYMIELTNEEFTSSQKVLVK